MSSNTQQFDLIIIDLFVDIEVPKPFLDLVFWRHINKASATNGAIIFNASLEKTKSTALNDVIDFLKTQFYKTEVYEKVNQTNTIIITTGL